MGKFGSKRKGVVLLDDIEKKFVSCPLLCNLNIGYKVVVHYVNPIYKLF